MQARIVVTVELTLAALSAPAFAQDTTSSVTTTSSAPPTTVVQPAPTTVVQPAPTQVVVQPVPVGQATTTSGPLLVNQKEEKTEGAQPNTALLTTGLVMLGGFYVTSVIVGASSDHQGDGHLFVPIAGPWMDIGDRGGCPAGSSCDGETTNKVLLGADGVFQALGALQIIGAFLMPETRTVATVHTTAFNDVTFTPARMGVGGYGFAAFAAF